MKLNGEDRLIRNKLTLPGPFLLFIVTGPICALHSPHDSSNVRERLQFPEIYLRAAAIKCINFLRPVYELLRAELQEETQPGD